MHQVQSNCLQLVISLSDRAWSRSDSSAISPRSRATAISDAPREACAITQPALSMQIRDLEHFLGVTAGGAAAGRGDADRARPGDLPPWRRRAGVGARSRRFRPPSQQAADGTPDARHHPVARALSAAAHPAGAAIADSRICSWNCAKRRPGCSSRRSRAARSTPRCWRCRSASPTSTPWSCSTICSCSRCRRAIRGPANVAWRRDDIDQARLILLEDGHCLRDQALAFCATIPRGPTPGSSRHDVRRSSLATVMQMVAGGYGVTLIPQIAADVEARDEQGEIPAAGRAATRPQHRPGVPHDLAAQGGFRGAGRGGEGECATNSS